MPAVVIALATPMPFNGPAIAAPTSSGFTGMALGESRSIPRCNWHVSQPDAAPRRIKEADVTKPDIPLTRATQKAVDCFVLIQRSKLGLANAVDPNKLALQFIPKPLVTPLLAKLDLAVVDGRFP